MNVSLSPELQRFLNEQVQSGRQQSGDEDDRTGLNGHRNRRLAETPARQVRLSPW